MARGGKRDGAGRPEGALNKATADIKAMAQEFGPMALQVLCNIAQSGESESAKVAASNAILDRAYGKPKQSMDIDANVKAAIQTVERQIVRPPHTNG